MTAGSLTAGLQVLALLGSGLTAGVLFAVALSVVPALALMPADRYVYAHQLLGRNWDPTMPVVVLSSTALDAALAFLTPNTAVFALAAVALLGVSAVSHLANVPINRVVRTTDPDGIPPGWRDPRPLWRNWNLLRTGLAVLALLVNGLAAVLS